jgi:hypothetical protein
LTAPAGVEASGLIRPQPTDPRAAVDRVPCPGKASHHAADVGDLQAIGNKQLVCRVSGSPAIMSWDSTYRCSGSAVRLTVVDLRSGPRNHKRQKKQRFAGAGSIRKLASWLIRTPRTSESDHQPLSLHGARASIYPPPISSNACHFDSVRSSRDISGFPDGAEDTRPKRPPAEPPPAASKLSRVRPPGRPRPNP